MSRAAREIEQGGRRDVDDALAPAPGRTTLTGALPRTLARREASPDVPRRAAGDVGGGAPDAEAADGPFSLHLDEGRRLERLLWRAHAEGGQALPGDTRARLEAALGTSLAEVSVHTGSAAAAAAAELEAEAFAVGTHLYFAGGAWAPGTPEGDHLIAHEVAHAVQQRHAPGVAARAIVGPSGGALELEAEGFAEAFSAGLVDGRAVATLSAAPAGAVSRHGRGQRGRARGSTPAVRGGGPRPSSAQVLHLRWRGSARESYRGFFRGVSRDAAEIERWIDDLLALPTRWQYRGNDVPLAEFERLANERQLGVFPVYGGALPYIERVTGLRVPQLRAIGQALEDAERAQAAAETTLAEIEHGRAPGGEDTQGTGVQGAGAQGAGAQGAGAQGTAAQGTGVQGGGAQGTPGRGPLAAAPSEVRGPERMVVGGRGTFEMRVTLGTNDTSNNPLEDSRAIDRGTFTWDVFDGTALARARTNERAAASPAPGPAAVRPGADPRVAQLRALQQGGAAPGGRTVTASDSNADELRRIDHSLSTDTARAAADYDTARRGGHTADAILGATNVLLTPTSAAVAYGGYVLNRVVEQLFGTDAERAIPFPSAGTFFVRCVAQPRNLDGSPARPPSVAVHVVEVAEAHSMAREALDEPNARIAELELRLDQASDPAARAAVERQLDEARTQASGSAGSVIALSRDRLSAERLRVLAELATVEARPAANADEEVSRVGRLRALRERRDALDAQLRELGAHLELAATRHRELGGGTFRPRAVIVDQDSGDRLELLLESSEPLPQGDGYHCTVSDVTTARGRTYEGVGANRTEAIWAALRSLATGNDYGRGRLFVRLPDSVGVAGPSERDFTNAPGSTALLRQRLGDLGTVATALAAVSVPGAGEVAMLAGATTAAMNLASRMGDHTLRLDADAINDVLNVVTAVAGGAQVVGRLRIDRAAGRVALVPVEASTLARAAQGVSTAVDRVQVITTTAATIEQFESIAQQEASGTISHARARELRARALIGHLQMAWTTAAPLARSGGDGSTGEQVVTLPDAPEPVRSGPPAVEPVRSGPPAVEPVRSGPPAVEPVRSGPPAVEPRSPGPAPGPGPGGASVEPSSSGHREPGERDALVPPPPSAQAHADPASGQPANGQPANGQAASGQSASGQPASGQAANGQPASGQAANGQAHVGPADATTRPALVPPPPADAIEAHQIARMQRVVPLILTLPAGTHIVPNATPDPLPVGWMRLSQFSSYLRMLGHLRSVAPGQNILYGIANSGGVITMNAGQGHFQNGTHINIDPSVHTTGVGRAGMTGHEGDHLTRGPAPHPSSYATEDAYVAAMMHFEALAQARLLEVRRAILENSGGAVTPDGANIPEFGSREYFPAYQRAHDAHLAAHPGDAEGARNAGIDAGVRAIAVVWPNVPVSIPGVGTYDRYARNNYRNARNPPAARVVVGQPSQADPAASTVPTLVPPPPTHADPAATSSATTLVPPAPRTGDGASGHSGAATTLVPPAPRIGDGASGHSGAATTLVPPAPRTGDGASGHSGAATTLVPPAPRTGDGVEPTLPPPPRVPAIDSDRTTVPYGTEPGREPSDPIPSAGPAPGPRQTRAERRAAADAAREELAASSDRILARERPLLARAQAESRSIDERFFAIGAELVALGLPRAQHTEAAAAVEDDREPYLPPAARPNRARIVELLQERVANRQDERATYAERVRRQAAISAAERRADVAALYAELRPLSPGNSAEVRAIRAAATDVLGLPATADNPMAAEHLVPVSDIVLMPGFSSIRSREAQLAILNRVENLVPLTRAPNSSRGNEHWGAWQGWQQFATTPARRAEMAEARAQLAARQDALIPQIQGWIDAALRAQGG